MAKYVEVVMFYGPPFAGKTAYYRHHLKTSHQRISANDLFTENPDLGLRQIILRVVSLLKQGVNVTIDDENWLQNTRLSYIKSISSKVPSCKFRCVKFNPGTSPLTLRWLEEWYLAKSNLNGDEPSLDDLAGREARILRWFGGDSLGRGPECPKVQEEISLQDVHVELTAEEEYKFEVPALFIQWEGVFQPDDDKCGYQCHEGTRDLLQTWTTVNPWGRIIIIADGPCCADSKVRSSSDQTVLGIKQTLVKLGKSLASPVYFCCLLKPKSASSFAKPPQPGLLAFLQRLHRIHLWHPSTLYLYESKDHADSAKAAGVKHYKAASALESPDMIHRVQCSYKEDDIDPILKDIKLFGPPESSQQRSAPMVPLYSEAVEVGDGGCYVQELSCGRAIGICFKDEDTLKRYQKLYAETASHITDPESRMTACIPERSTADENRQTTDSAVRSQHTNTRTTSKSDTQQTTRGLPSWMMSQSLKTRKKDDQLIDESLQDSCMEEPVRKKKGHASPLMPSTVYCMSSAELYETALLVLQEEQMKDSEKANLETTSTSSQETQTRASLQIAATETKTAEKGRDNEAATSSDEKGGKAVGGEARFPDDLFYVDSAGMKPPPRKAMVPRNIQTTSNSPSVLPEYFAPETVTCVPETAGYSVASMRTRESTTTNLGESSVEQRVEGTKASKGPDFSFLDDIF